jgi:hypothetical protein
MKKEEKELLQKGFNVAALLGGGDGLQVWVDFNDEVRVKLRYISREEMAGIIKKSTVIEFVNHQKRETLDNLKYGELVGLAAIADWSGLVQGSEPFPCTPENVKQLMRLWGDFAKFVSDFSSDFERLVAADKEAERKNS